MEVKIVAEEQKIWDKKEEVVKSKEEAKKLVSQKFYIFEKKISEKIPTKKI